MTKVIDATDVITALADERDRRGADFVYANENPDSCQYVVDGEPSCIAGGALIFGLGLSFSPKMGYKIEGSIIAVRDQLEATNDVKFTDRAILVLAIAQSVQDNGGTHGLAFTAADNVQASISYGMPQISDEVNA